MSISGGGNNVRATLQTTQKSGSLVRFTGGSFPAATIEHNVFTAVNVAADAVDLSREEEICNQNNLNIKKQNNEDGGEEEIETADEASVLAKNKSFSMEGESIVASYATQSYCLTSDDGGMIFSTS